VLDSLSIAAMGVQDGNAAKTRREIFDFIRTLKKTGVTALLITEIPEGDKGTLSRFGFEEFVSDSVIVLRYFEYAAGGNPRSLSIRKMRRTSHSTNVSSMDIKKDGIKILPLKKGIIV